MRNFVGKWGLTYKEIISMPREQFANKFGQRFLNMHYCEFKRTIKSETPFSKNNMGKLVNLSKWRPDCQVTKKDYKGTQMGAWCDPSFLI